jgi:hypothetical protein
LVFATVFVVNRGMIYGMIYGKYFWFYCAMGLLSPATMISLIFNKKHFRFSVLDWLIALFIGSVYLSALVFNDASQNMTKLTLLALLTVLYFFFRLIPKDDKYKHVFCIFVIISGLDSGIWVGLDLGKQEQISRIRYLPRNDDNNIRIGDSYELFYWDKGAWSSLGKQTGDDTHVLIYENCPANALFLLHNHTRGKEERIFTYEHEKQMFW